MDEILMSKVGRHLKSWSTGRAVPDGMSGTGSATVVVEDARHLQELRDSGVVGPETVVLVPAGQEEPSHDALVVGYEGSLSEPGGDVAIADAIFVQTQDYNTSPYMSLVGTTLIRITCDADLDAFLADADLARNEGAFADFAASQAVQIADLSCLGDGSRNDGPRTRLYANQVGELSTSPGGLRLGSVGDRIEGLVAEWERINETSAFPCAVGLGAVVTEGRRSEGLGQRLWLGRYLDALDMLRELQGRGITEIRVSGFGGRLVPALEDLADPADASGDRDPMLAWTPEACYLRVPGSGRLFALSRTAAQLTEVLLTCGDIESALDHAERDDLERVAGFLDRNGVRLPVAPAVGAGV
ncbi:hypothetical protein JOL79_31710 [Microbispora sp. RL4-1S]|uniref:Uncharacterized protein n=1 Tax=Microbispora oryzae TaxID=2806554 RepID=A0A941AL96_9ACTN|nr:daptide biosynthesis RiPP recognition protein [Microbispora oryzae]MBP2708355.1 hypothetical protein [Microbispora oryzae]